MHLLTLQVLTVTTLERVILVTWPHKAAIWCKPKRALRTILVIGLILFAINSPNLAAIRDKEYGDYDHCTIFEIDIKNYSEIWTILHLILYNMVPSIIIITTNSLIIRKILWRSKIRRNCMSREEKRMTLTLITVSLFFLLTTSPISIYQMWRENLTDKSQSIEFWDGHDTIMAVLLLISYLNNSCNFYLYVLTASRFRAELRNMFCCRAQVKPFLDVISSVRSEE